MPLPVIPVRAKMNGRDWNERTRERTMLPQDFLNRMEKMLREEYPAFLESYETERYQALRVNTLKAECEEITGKMPFSLTKVPWAASGYYYTAGDAPGKHPYHEAGVYYIQEPSAMAPAEYLMCPFETGLPGEEVWEDDAMQIERILDLCAAPGGKSTQIAAAMQGKGILISNEIHPARAKILSENVERMGICNAMVTNETPQRLTEHFPEYFTRILVDAPCSGEGMFRKNEEACEQWSLANVVLCAERQDEILDCAASMLAPGGRLVYSTCTFAPAENEGSILRFLGRHPEFEIEQVPLLTGMAHGIPAWGNWGSLDVQAGDSAVADAQEEKMMQALTDTIRLWPHRLKGEGHYLAVLRKAGALRRDVPGFCAGGIERGIPERDSKVPGKGCLEYLEFAENVFTEVGRKKYAGPGARYLKFGDQLYLIPEGMPSLKGLKVLRPGLHLGTIKKGRFEPSHALALAAKPGEVIHTTDLTADGNEIRSYLNGGTFPAGGEKGWYLVTVDGYGTGWGKLAGGIMKNHYPKGLRKQL